MVNITLIILIIIIVLIIIFLVWYMTQKKNTSEKTLYDRLGGVYSIAALVDYFSDALINNPIVGNRSPNKFLRDWHTNQLDRLPGLKFMRTLWLCSISGGPFKYSPTVPGKCPFSFENAHNKFNISPQEFDEVARILSASLDHFAVPQKEKNEVLSAFAAHKSEVNTGFFNSKNIAAETPKC